MSNQEVTRLLAEVSEGRKSAAEQLMPLVFDELRRLARSFFASQRPDHTLQPTALVNEAYLKMVGQEGTAWSGRAHFFAVAAKAMRQILINHAEAKQAAKRGAGWHRITLAAADSGSASQEADMIALNDALSILETLDQRQAQVIELRFFGGLTVEETASILGVAPRTIELDWRMAKAWLADKLRTG